MTEKTKISEGEQAVLDHAATEWRSYMDYMNLADAETDANKRECWVDASKMALKSYFDVIEVITIVNPSLATRLRKRV